MVLGNTKTTNPSPPSNYGVAKDIFSSSKIKSNKTNAYIMKTPTLEDILKIASFKFNEDGELIQTSLDADFIGYHEGNHFGCHQGNHYGDHYGDHHGDHIGDHIMKKQDNQSNDSNLNLSAASGSVPLTILPPLPKKEILKAPERREIRGYTAAQMMDYANAAVAATREQNNH